MLDEDMGILIEMQQRIDNWKKKYEKEKINSEIRVKEINAEWSALLKNQIIETDKWRSLAEELMNNKSRRTQ